MENEKLRCCVCNNSLGGYHTTVAEYKIYKCTRCGLESTFPVPSSDELKAFYTGYSDFRADLKVTERNAALHIEILKKYGFNRKTRTLDYGAGTGGFVKALEGICVGYDPFAKKKKNLFNSIEDLPFQLFDTVTCWSVLDNQRDPSSTIKECSNLLKNGGLFAFSVVSTETEIPFRYKPPEHLTYWTKESIRLLLKALHFELLFLEQDTMWQRSNVYIDLICSRIPDTYHTAFKHAKLELPEYVQIPTNELFCVSRKL